MSVLVDRSLIQILTLVTGMSDSAKWYQEFYNSIKESLTECCGVHPEDAGSCSDGCCDEWRCPQCGKTWTQELGD